MKKKRLTLVEILVVIFIVGILAAIFAPRFTNEDAQAETQAPEVYDPWESVPDSVKKEYEKEMREAESSVDGYADVSGMEAHLTLAELVIEDANLPEEADCTILSILYEKAEEMRRKAYPKAVYQELVYIFENAHDAHKTSTEDYRLYCSKAGLQPDKEKLIRAQEILATALAERKKLKN